MKKITILGSTGSIGTQTLDVVRKNKDKFEVVAISANSSVDLLLEQILEFKPKYVAVYNEKSANKLKNMIPNDIDIEVLSSMEGLVKICELEGSRHCFNCCSWNDRSCANNGCNKSKENNCSC